MIIKLEYFFQKLDINLDLIKRERQLPKLLFPASFFGGPITFVISVRHIDGCLEGSTTSLASVRMQQKHPRTLQNFRILKKLFILYD